VIILGIDPGTAALGYGVVERNGGLRALDHGCRTTTPEVGLPARLLAIHAALLDLIDLYEPEVLAVERVFFSRNAQTAFAVGQARGVVLLAAAERAVPVVEATPSAVKIAVAGSGRADKDQVATMVARILGLAEPPTPDDAADALAVAVWAAHTWPVGAGAAAGPLDLAAAGPSRRGRSPFEAAVAEALAREAAEVGRRPGR
jgi:crossover junction endodeoxyribonuclease RuvC